MTMLTAEKLKLNKGDKLFIGGKWVEAHSEKAWPVYNPAAGKKLADVVIADKKDVDRAVAAARKAFESPPWRKMNASERGRLLIRIAHLIEKHADELAQLEVLNNGKTIREASSSDLPASWKIFEYYAGWANKYHGETIPVDGPYLNYTLREPLGVVGQIIPWNYPLLMACWKIAPALSMGNTVVLKPAELTPLTALRLADLLNEAGVPDGVVNIVTGEGSTGALIAEHLDIDKVAFTGSTDVGRKILEASARSNLKRVSLELGGKSPNVVFPDADLDAAVQSAFWAIFINKGEVCSAGSRLVVHKKIYDEFLDKLVGRAQKMRVGDPLDPKSEMGAQVSKDQMERILQYVDIARKEGARLACGGERDTGGDKKSGYFVKPTVFADVKNTMRIAQEEVFGPVLAAIPFKSEDEAVRICNQSIYGLVAAVWTRDIGRAHTLARKIQSGTVWINLYDGFDVASPFGGYKQSGFGREMGVHALHDYTQVKSVWVALEKDEG